MTSTDPYATRWAVRHVAHTFHPILAAALITMVASDLHAAAPTVEYALALEPFGKNVDYDRPPPDVAAHCTIAMEKFEGTNAWVVRDPNGRLLRAFADANGDRVVDRWIYFKDGSEVYRDIDSDFNAVADQSRRSTAAAGRGAGDALSVRSQSRRPFIRR